MLKMFKSNNEEQSWTEESIWSKWDPDTSGEVSWNKVSNSFEYFIGRSIIPDKPQAALEAVKLMVMMPL